MVSVGVAKPQEQAPRRLESQRVDEFLAQQAHGRGAEQDDALLVQADDALIRPKIEQLRQMMGLDIASRSGADGFRSTRSLRPILSARRPLKDMIGRPPSRLLRTRETQQPAHRLEQTSDHEGDWHSNGQDGDWHKEHETTRGCLRDKSVGQGSPFGGPSRCPRRD